ncbi:MAG: hypothetical protein H0X50_06640 [Nitrosopumilus sp.]|nr:hypothetical protein [Nitrosopumilus sp.]
MSLLKIQATQTAKGPHLRNQEPDKISIEFFCKELGRKQTMKTMPKQQAKYGLTRAYPMRN